MSRNVLVIGGSGEIGAETVRQFRAMGDNVVFTYHKSELAADALRQETGAIPVRCDVKFSNSVKIAADKAQNILGCIDVLICNAAISDTRSFVDTDEARWEEIINTNLSGVFHCIRNVLPLMIQRRHGCIIAVAPKYDTECGMDNAACSAAAAGVAGLAEALNSEVSTYSISVKCIKCEGPKETVSVIRNIVCDEV